MTKVEKLKAITLLYVEDDELVRLGVYNFLKRRCKEVYLAENGQEGLEQFHKYCPEMIITDIEMPVMNGMEMIKEILESKERQPIIITTGYNDDEHKSDRVCRNIIKPINLQELLEAICACLKLEDD